MEQLLIFHRKDTEYTEDPPMLFLFTDLCALRASVVRFLLQIVRTMPVVGASV